MIFDAFEHVKVILALKTRCVTWPFWPVRTRPITGQHGPAGQTGQHRPGRVRRTAPAHITRAAQRHSLTHSPHTHTRALRAHTHRISRLGYCAILCVAAFAAAVFYSKNRYDETTVLISIHVMHVVSSSRSAV